jgi:K+-transporting ATPase ATPase C chain
MRRALYTSVRLFLLLTLLTGVLYPFLLTGVAGVFFPRQARGSLVFRNGVAVGSSLLAQRFDGPTYIWPRPSAVDYATNPSGASNLAVTSGGLSSRMPSRARRWALASGSNAPGSLTMLSASGSGLDPHITPADAHAQLARVATARRWNARQVQAAQAAVRWATDPPQLGFLGEERVNVLLLNLALDKL